MTVANQLEMQRQLKALADRHKKAKLQELFSKQDELRPFTNTENSKSRQENENAEMEAMKVQFNDLQKEQLKQLIKKDFDLRIVKEEKEKEKQTEKEEGEKTKSHNLYGYGSDGSGDQKIDTEDVEAMKAEFDKYQKILLQTQIEKSFRLRVPKKNKNKTGKPGIDEIFDQSLSSDDEEDNERKNKKTEQEERDLIESIKQDSEKMNQKYHEMNKMMLRMRSKKMLETTIEPQIKPQHKERFEVLLQDIGIINQSITDKLWTNIVDAVGHRADNIKNDDDIINEDEIVDVSMDTKDIVISKLEKENKLLQQQIKYMQQQLSSLNPIESEQNQVENDNANDADDEQIDAYDDGEMLIIN